MQANVSKELHVYKRGKNECPGKDHQKCFGRVKEKAKNNRRRLITRLRQGKKYSAKYVNVKRKCVVLRRAKEVSCAALLSLFRRLMLSSTAEVDVADSPY